jgi:hypothetical protein
MERNVGRLEEGGIGGEKIEAVGVLLAKRLDFLLGKGVRFPQVDQVVFIARPDNVLQDGDQQAVDADNDQGRRLVEGAIGPGVAQKLPDAENVHLALGRLYHDPRL